MNYIRHLHAFYHHVKRDTRLTSTHISLYMAIFQFWNYNRFQNPFPVFREELMQFSKIGSKNTYHKCIKDLHQAGYLVYHSGLTKFYPIKISMVRLHIKEDENAYQQLDLFDVKNAPSSGSDTCLQKGQNEASKIEDFDHDVNPLNGSCRCTGIDTLSCPGCDTPSCPTFDTTSVPILTATGPTFDTVSVSNSVHIIKHKQINSKQCVCKTEKNTHTNFSKKNIKEENAITNLANNNNLENEQNQDAPRRTNSVHENQINNPLAGKESGLNLPLVEDYFRQNNFPLQEAPKFFYYNQGRGWLLPGNLPVQDWQALAQKWMLNTSYTKIVQHGKAGNQHQAIDPGPGKDYSEPL